MPVGFGRVGDVRITRVGVTMQSTVKSCFSSSRPSSSDVTCGRGCFQKQTAGEQQLQPVQTCESLTLVTTSVFSVTAPISRSMPARRSLARLRREGGDRRLQRDARTVFQFGEPFAFTNACASLGTNCYRAHDDQVDNEVLSVNPERLAVLGRTCDSRQWQAPWRVRCSYLQMLMPRVAPPLQAGSHAPTAG